MVVPVMPFMDAMGLFLSFNANYFTLFACEPPTKRWSESRTSGFYMIMIAMNLALVLCFFTVIMSGSVF